MKNNSVFDRRNTSIFSHWWWTVDRVNLFLLLGLMVFGAVLVTAASPPVAARIGFDSYHFVTRQHIFLFLSVLIMIAISMT